MSTGDQTQYVRSKIAERGSERGAHFMMDGFDRWAESETPARAGQMEKMPAESQMENYGGAMTLSKAKRLQSMMSKHGGAMGGASISVGGIQIPIPEYIDKGIKAAKDLIKVVEWTLNFVDEFADDLTDNVIDKPQFYAPAIIEDSKELITVLNSLKPYMDSVRYMLDLAKSLGLSGSGKHGGKMVGGDWAATFQAAQQTAQAIIDWYLWLKQKAATIRTVLKLQSVQKVGGQQLLDYLEPIFGAVGFGRHGGRGKHCCCDSSSDSEYHGGALPVLDLSAPRKVGGRGSMKKLKSLLMPGHIPKLPPIPKFVGGRHGGNRGREPRALVNLAGGMSAAEKMQLLSPKEKALMKLPTGGRKVGGRAIRNNTFEPQMPGPVRPIGGRAIRNNTFEPQMPGPVRGMGRKGGAFKCVIPGAPVKDLSHFDEATCNHYRQAVERSRTFQRGDGKPKKVGGASCGGKKPSARGEIVKKVMREQGLSLPQASKYVKEHGLY